MLKGSDQRAQTLRILKELPKKYHLIIKITKIKCGVMGTIFKIVKKESLIIYKISKQPHRNNTTNRNYITVEQ